MWVSKGPQKFYQIEELAAFVQTWQVKEKGKEKCPWEASAGASGAGCAAPTPTPTPGTYLPTAGWDTLPLRKSGVLDPPLDPTLQRSTCCMIIVPLDRPSLPLSSGPVFLRPLTGRTSGHSHPLDPTALPSCQHPGSPGWVLGQNRMIRFALHSF